MASASRSDAPVIGHDLAALLPELGADLARELGGRRAQVRAAMPRPTNRDAR